MYRKKENAKRYRETHKQKISDDCKIWRRCNKEKVRGYIKKYWANPKNKTIKRAQAQRGRNRLKVLVFSHYSPNGIPQCACCKEQRLIFLTLDHMDGNGAKHKRSLGIHGGSALYCWLKKNNYPPGYRVLCFNCNYAIFHLGFCPHVSPLSSPVASYS